MPPLLSRSRALRLFLPLVIILAPAISLSQSQKRAENSKPKHVFVPSVAAKPEDVASVDSLIKAFYEVISGPAGQPRQWARDRTLYAPGVRFVSIEVENGKPRPVVMDHQTYVDRVDRGFVRGGFFEREIHRVERRFGNMAHVYSTYEWKTAEGGKVEGRGINSIEMYYDGGRWWIASVVWEDERADNPIPKEFLP